MPIYEYVCRECGHELEQLQRLSDDALTDCPACGEAALKRKISAAGFRLSGGGWYETDFKSDGRRNLSASENASESGDGKAAAKNDGAGDKTVAGGDKDKGPAKSAGESKSDKKSGDKKSNSTKSDTPSKPKQSGSAA